MKKIEAKIIWEDDQLAVVYKPAGMVVNRMEKEARTTLQDWVEENLKLEILRKGVDEDLLKIFKSRSGIAHRLDKETSGCLLVAKNEQSLAWLMKQFKERKIIKEYLSLVHGWVEPKKGRVRLPLAEAGKGDSRRQMVKFDGKVADTEWETVDRYKDGDLDNKENQAIWENKLSLLKIRISTGRKHQIRAHFSYLGYPVYADSRYLNKQQAQADRRGLNRHFLQAMAIGFYLPSNKWKEIRIDLDNELVKLLNRLKKEQ